MEDGSWSWLDFNFEQCWEKISKLWQTKALRDNLAKDSKAKDLQKGEEDATVQEVRPRWRSASSIWAEGDEL